MKVTEVDVIWTPLWWDDAEHPGLIRIEKRGSGWKRTRGDFWMHANSFGTYGVGLEPGPIMDALAMFILFNTIVVRDGVPVEKAHEAFLKIDEYRKMISPDCPGAEQ